MPTAISWLGSAAGGGISVTFTCSGCAKRKVTFNSSSILPGSNRSVVGTRLALAFITTGHTYAEYRKTLGEHLGLRCYSGVPYNDLIRAGESYIGDVLNSMMDTAKEACRHKDPNEIGSAKRMCVTSDGAWQTKGFHSANGTFVIIDYVTQGLLWRGHRSQKGSKDDDLYEGTSKSMEANLALCLYGQAQKEGFVIAIVWQDDDSSSALSVKLVYPDILVMKCGGHVGRAGNGRLMQMASLKAFSKHMKDLYRQRFPEVGPILVIFL